MTTDTEDTLRAILALNRRIERLERAMRDTLDALENQSPAHAERHLKDALDGAR